MQIACYVLTFGSLLGAVLMWVAEWRRCRPKSRC